jgi:hypothetical protein
MNKKEASWNERGNIWVTKQRLASDLGLCDVTTLTSTSTSQLISLSLSNLSHLSFNHNHMH